MVKALPQSKDIVISEFIADNDDRAFLFIGEDRTIVSDALDQLRSCQFYTVSSIAGEVTIVYEAKASQDCAVKLYSVRKQGLLDSLFYALTDTPQIDLIYKHSSDLYSIVKVFNHTSVCRHFRNQLVDFS